MEKAPFDMRREAKLRGGVTHDATAVILAAGLGTRMRSALPKALHPIAGRPMLRHLLASCEAVFERIVVVAGPDMPGIAAAAAPYPVVVQTERLGTAHAALQAVSQFGTGEVAILYADNPLILPETLERLLARCGAGDVGLALLAMRPPDPARYGRVIGPIDKSGPASSNGSSSLPTRPPPSGPRRCATPVCCARPPPTWPHGSARSAATTPSANTT